MTFKTIATTLATATALTGFASMPAKAGPITTLGECYQAVISWCTETYPGADCSQSSGLEDCDEVFGDTANAGKTFKMSLPGRHAADVFIKVPDIAGESQSRRAGRSGGKGTNGGRSADGATPPRADSEMVRPPRETATAVTTVREPEMRIPIPSPIPRSPIPSPRP